MAYILASKPMYAADFNAKNRKIVGHLESLKLDGKELTPAFNFRNPLDPNNFLKVAALLTWFEWDLKKGGNVRMEGRLPNENKSVYQQITYAPNKNAHISFKLHWYECDLTTGKYFKCCSTGEADFEGQISPNDPPRIENDPASGEDEYVAAPNHFFSLTLLGSDKVEKQEFAIDYGKQVKDSVAWGQKVGG